MKVGFSFGRCLRDIVKGIVNAEDVVVIICGTYMTSIEEMHGVVDAYMLHRARLRGLDDKKCKQVATLLWNSGKIHQPRIASGGGLLSIHEEYIWMDLYPTSTDCSVSVTNAWNNYQMILKLASDYVPPQWD
jgi:hypothetical protein